MSLLIKTSLIVKFIVQSTKRHPRVIDLDRGKTLAKGNVRCMNLFSEVLIQQSKNRADQFGRSVTAVPTN